MPKKSLKVERKPFFAASQPAEECLLGTLMRDSEQMQAVAGIVAPGDFYFPEYRQVAEAIWELFSIGKPTDIVSVYEELKHKELPYEDLALRQFLIDLMSTVPDASYGEHYARIIKERSLKRQLAEVGRVVQESAQSEEPVKQTIGTTQEKLLEIADAAMFESSVANTSFAAESERICENYQSGKTLGTGIMTQFKEIDKMSGGLMASDLVLLAGRPSVGKTTLALNFVENLAYHQSVPVLFVTLESSAKQITYNLLCARAEVDGHKIRTGYAAKDDLPKLRIAGVELNKAPIYIVDTVPMTTTALRLLVHQECERHKIQVLMIDYLQLIVSAQTREHREQEVAEISRSLKAIAKEFGVVVLALCQLSRAIELRAGDALPKLADLRESGALEQDADVVWMMHRKPKENTTLVLQAKHRVAPPGKCYLCFHPKCLKFVTEQGGEE